MACCETSCCWARVGMRPIVTVGVLAAVCARVCLLERARTSCNCCSFPLSVPMPMCGMGWIRAIIGTPPSVFALVWRQCMCGVFFKALFAVGLRACMMGGAFEIRGMVRIGVSSITLFSSSLTLCCSLVTLCSDFGVAVNAGGNNFNRRLPLLVEAATAVVSRSSSLRARRCWCGDMFGIWQCCGKSSADHDMGYACVLGT